jgi:hypothetical protein
MGWDAVVEDAASLISRRAEVLRVPHHGAPDAHSPEVWQRLLGESVHAIVSPYTRGARNPISA